MVKIQVECPVCKGTVERVLTSVNVAYCVNEDSTWLNLYGTDMLEPSLQGMEIAHGCLQSPPG